MKNRKLRELINREINETLKELRPTLNRLKEGGLNQLFDPKLIDYLYTTKRLPYPDQQVSETEESSACILSKGE